MREDSIGVDRPDGQPAPRRPGRGGRGGQPPAPPAGRVRRPGPAQGAPEIVLEAARRRGQAATICCSPGPPGLGKTTLAGIVAAEMGVSLASPPGRPWSGPGTWPPSSPTLPKATSSSSTRSTGWAEPSRSPVPGDGGLRPRHRAGQRPGARSIRLDLPRFTLIGATTRTGPHHRAASGPLRLRRPPRLLRARGAGGDHRSFGAGSSASTSTTTAPPRSRAAPGARPESPTGC